MITKFLSNRVNLNIIQVFLSTMILYVLMQRYSMFESMIIGLLMALLAMVVHIKAIAKGMMFVKDDPLMKKWLHSLKKFEEKDSTD